MPQPMAHVFIVDPSSFPIHLEYLDRYLRDPERCIWSLVYRKLKGARGCTMIFPWEDDFLLELIKDTNEKAGRTPLLVNDGRHISWNPVSNEIEIRTGSFASYDVHSDDHVSPPEDPLREVLSQGRESYLQAFLTANYRRRFPDSEVVFGRTETVAWVGNEVACGLGMQKIDIFVINENQSEPLFRVIELKKDPPDDRTVWQLARYVDWTKRFVRGAASHNIQPILLCRNLSRIPLSPDTRRSFREFNDAELALPIKYVECGKARTRLKYAFVRSNTLDELAVPVAARARVKQTGT